MELKITEGKKDDISTVYAYLVTPEERGIGPHGDKLQPKMCDYWSEFGGAYESGAERKFIAQVDAENRGKYSHYHITYDNCN
jgi:hypothetical protein